MGYLLALQPPVAVGLESQTPASSSLPPAKQPTPVQTPTELEDLVKRYLAAAATDVALARPLHQQILATRSALLKQTWEEIAGRSQDIDAADVRHVLSTLRDALATQDPMAAIQWLAGKARSDQLVNQLWSMLEAWSVREPKAAWEGMIADTIAPGVRDKLNNAFTTICENFAWNDPAAAFATFLKLPPDHWLPDYSAEILCRDATSPARRADMLQQLMQRPPGRLRTTGLKIILAFQTQNQSPERTGNWLLDQPLPPEEKDALIASLAAAAAPDDPRAALIWLMAHSRPEAAPDSLEKLTAEWASAAPND